MHRGERYENLRPDTYRHISVNYTQGSEARERAGHPGRYIPPYTAFYFLKKGLLEGLPLNHLEEVLEQRLDTVVTYDSLSLFHLL